MAFADLVAEVDLDAGWGDDLAAADDPRAVRLRAGEVGRELLGLSSGEPRKAQPRRKQAGEWTQTVDPRFISRFISRVVSSRFSGHVPSPPWSFFITQPGSAVRHCGGNTTGANLTRANFTDDLRRLCDDSVNFPLIGLNFFSRIVTRTGPR